MRVEILSRMPSGELCRLVSDQGLKEADLLQHLSFTFAVEGISRACSHQLVWHRLASFFQKSYRYAEVRRLGEHVVVPRAVEERAKKTFGEFIKALGRFYDRMIESGCPRRTPGSSC